MSLPEVLSILPYQFIKPLFKLNERTKEKSLAAISSKFLDIIIIQLHPQTRRIDSSKIEVNWLHKLMGDTTIRVKRSNIDWRHVQGSCRVILLRRGGGR